MSQATDEPSPRPVSSGPVSSGPGSSGAASSGEGAFVEPPYDQWAVAQPHEMWTRARAECPVVERPGTPWDERATFQVTRYDDVARVLRDPDTFSSAINSEVIGQFMGELILGLGGDEHRAYRDLVAHAFRPSMLEQWEQTLVRPVITRLLDAFAAEGRAELVAQLTSKYPVQVICGIVGVPLDDHDQFVEWAEAINYGPLDPPAGLAASQAMRAYLEPLVEARRARPTGDLLSELVHAEVDGVRLTDERIHGFLRLLLPAGAETTFRALGNALVALLTHPDDLARVTADRSLVPAAVEETLRWETSVTMVSRRATVDTELAGCPVPAGSAVTVLNGSAGRDESRWDHADEWDLDRPPQAHLAFGAGPHRCLGMHLARMEMVTGLNLILDRLPGLRLDPEAVPPTIVGYPFRGPDHLHVRFEPS